MTEKEKHQRPGDITPEPKKTKIEPPRSTRTARLKSVTSGKHFHDLPQPEKSPTISLPTQGKWMARDHNKSFVHEGTRYYPIDVAARIIQAPRTTLADWIKRQTLFAGQPLQVLYFEPANRYFISELSIQRAAQRFVKWPSLWNAGVVQLGPTDDKRGYIPLPKAAREIGISTHTMWLWATQGKAPDKNIPDVIKCPATEQYYIRESEVTRLKQFVPESGLRPGPRPGPRLKPTVN